MKKQVIVIGNGFASMFFIRYDITIIENGKLIYFPSIWSVVTRGWLDFSLGWQKTLCPWASRGPACADAA